MYLKLASECLDPKFECLDIPSLRWKLDDRWKAGLGEEDNGRKCLEAKLLSGKLSVDISLIFGDLDRSSLELGSKLRIGGFHGLAEGAPGGIEDQDGVMGARGRDKALHLSLGEGLDVAINPEVAISLASLCGSISLLNVAAVEPALLGSSILPPPPSLALMLVGEDRAGARLASNGDIPLVVEVIHRDALDPEEVPHLL